jgi:phosphoribosylglycinamide formyltransferase-1
VELQVYRVVNIHPSLLPAFVGVDGYLQAWNNGNQTTGATVHLIDTEIDTGPICAQEAFSIQDCTSIEEVRRLGQAVEHRLYPETLSWILNRQFSYQLTTETRRIHVRKN